MLLLELSAWLFAAAAVRCASLLGVFFLPGLTLRALTRVLAASLLPIVKVPSLSRPPLSPAPRFGTGGTCCGGAFAAGAGIDGTVENTGADALDPSPACWPKLRPAKAWLTQLNFAMASESKVLLPLVAAVVLADAKVGLDVLKLPMENSNALAGLLKFSFPNWDIDTAALWPWNRNSGLPVLAAEDAGCVGAGWKEGSEPL